MLERLVASIRDHLLGSPTLDDGRGLAAVGYEMTNVSILEAKWSVYHSNSANRRHESPS